MKAHVGLTLVAAAALAAGAAFAKTPGTSAAAPQEPSAMDRLIALEKQVSDLQTQLVALRKSQAQPASPFNGAPTPEQYADLRRQMDEVLAYLLAQSESAKVLADSLEDSREKGFTYGINPDSRIVLLEGMSQFTTALQTSVPQVAAPVIVAPPAQN
jgi:hypothetical protein